MGAYALGKFISAVGRKLCVLATHLVIDNVLTLGEIVHRPRSLFGEGLKPSALARAIIEQIAVGLEPDAPAEKRKFAIVKAGAA